MPSHPVHLLPHFLFPPEPSALCDIAFSQVKSEGKQDPEHQVRSWRLEVVHSVSCCISGSSLVSPKGRLLAHFKPHLACYIRPRVSNPNILILLSYKTKKTCKRCKCSHLRSWKQEMSAVFCLKKLNWLSCFSSSSSVCAKTLLLHTFKTFFFLACMKIALMPSHAF